MAFGITYETVNSAATRLRTESGNLDAVVRDMRKTADRYFAQWHAMSVETYTDAHMKWNKQAAEMQNDLETNIHRLYQIVARYQDGDAQAAKGM
ncbi:WXG100 family type VII secretion target [Krasilnikovia cinnamomea]|uniref:WXG100 family type VII secretion target n=1 Tax=Krasilnikovia cinnamomea TaxID=349313 RepID=A0A4Q7ZRK5_9ACTN|nr:WXG100 family type VII secretion target [Krasilnikovia cinnamomea]RZU53464.1 WXG100 family type VII secretion target [Krasilnikovia cinnamomea]